LIKTKAHPLEETKAKFSLVPVFINKVLLKHINDNFFMYCLGYSRIIMAENVRVSHELQSL
jgi:hypothetical protein